VSSSGVFHISHHKPTKLVMRMQEILTGRYNIFCNQLPTQKYLKIKFKKGNYLTLVTFLQLGW
jgi:hypothetical protein